MKTKNTKIVPAFLQDKAGKTYRTSDSYFYNDFREVLVYDAEEDERHLLKDGEWDFVSGEVEMASEAMTYAETEEREERRKNIIWNAKNRFVFIGDIKKNPFNLYDIAQSHREKHGVPNVSKRRNLIDYSDSYEFSLSIWTKYSDSIKNGQEPLNEMELEEYGFCTQDLIDFFKYQIEYDKQMNEHVKRELIANGFDD